MKFIKREYLPSKKFTVSLCAAILLVLIAIGFSYSNPSTTKVENNLTVDASSSLADLNPDWLKELQETDPVKIEQSNKELEEYQNLSPLSKLSRNLLSNIIASQPTNAPLDQDTVDNITQKAIADLPIKEIASVTKIEDLKFVSDDISASNLKTYIELFSKNYYQQTENFRKIALSDVNMMNTAITTNKNIDKAKMESIIVKYQSIIDGLKKITVPALKGSQTGGYYIALINDLERFVIIDKDFIQLKNNSIELINDLEIYGTTFEDILVRLQTFDAALKIKR